MGYYIVDAKGFVASAGSATSWSEVTAELESVGGKECKFLAEEGYVNIDDLMKELNTIKSPSSKIKWLKGIAKKCEDILIVTDGQENVIEMDLFEYYGQAQDRVIAAGYQEEIDRIRNIPKFEECTADQFFSEYVWCVLSAGMREQTVQKIWDNYFEKRDPLIIGHLGKRKAIVAGSKKYVQWFNELHSSKDPVKYLQTLPYIGKTTKYHLARNIGIDCVKPDRHTVRLSDYFGFEHPLEMCLEIQKHIPEEKLGTIDVILWRYCNLRALNIVEKII